MSQREDGSLAYEGNTAPWTFFPLPNDISLSCFLLMVEFLKFWWHCIHAGWEVGEGVFFFIETLCVLTSTGLLLHRKLQPEKWKKWEERIMKGAFCLFAGFFLLSTLFVAPFLKFSESAAGTQRAMREADTWSNRWNTIRAHEEQSRREKAEEEKAHEKKRVSDLENSARQRDTMLIAAATNASPLRAVLTVIAESNPRRPNPGSGNSFDLKSSELALADLEMKYDAQQTLLRMDEQAALDKCWPAFDYFIKKFRSALADLATSNGDVVSSDCNSMPRFITNGFRIAIRMGKHAGWNFDISFRGIGCGCMDIHCDPLTATLQLSGDNLETRFGIIGKGDLWKKLGPVRNCETNIDELITYMLAAQHRRVPITNTLLRTR